MARPAKFDTTQILDASLQVLVREGVRGVSMAAVARQLGAPSGSLYYRFATRDHLLAALWLRTVSGFQTRFIAQLQSADPPDSVVAAAAWVVSWCRQHPEEGRLLLLYRRRDLLDDKLPRSLARQAGALGAQLDAALAELQSSAWAGKTPDAATLRFVLAGIPQAAVRDYLAQGASIPEAAEDLVRRAVCGVLGMKGNASA